MKNKKIIDLIKLVKVKPLLHKMFGDMSLLGELKIQSGKFVEKIKEEHILSTTEVYSNQIKHVTNLEKETKKEEKVYIKNINELDESMVKLDPRNHEELILINKANAEKEKFENYIISIKTKLNDLKLTKEKIKDEKNLKISEIEAQFNIEEQIYEQAFDYAVEQKIIKYDSRAKKYKMDDQYRFEILRILTK